MTFVNSRMYRQVTLNNDLDPRMDVFRVLANSNPNSEELERQWSAHSAGSVLMRMGMFKPWFRKDARLAQTHVVWEQKAFNEATRPVYVLMLRNPFNWIASIHRRRDTGQWERMERYTHNYLATLWLQYADTLTRMLQNPLLKGRVVGTTLEQICGSKAQISERLANLVEVQVDLLQGYEPSRVRTELADRERITAAPFLLDGWAHWTRATAT